jgi:hypothetical protein
MRLVALSGLLICSLAATDRAAGNDADRFVETAKKLIQAINRDDSATIQANFDAQMQQLLPPDKATPFFRGMVSAKGKLKDAGIPQVTGPTAIVRVTAERGAWDFKISLDAADKIAGLLITGAAAKASAPGSPQRFLKVANKLIQAINSDDSAAIQASLDSQMQQALPADKATPFFCGLVSAAGKLKGSSAPQATGSTAIVRVTAERGAWDFKISLDDSDQISELSVTAPGGSAPAAASSTGSPVRDWSDITGKFHVKAELMGVKDGKVELKKTDGEIINVPLAKLSAQDQDALKKLPSPAATK